MYPVIDQLFILERVMYLRVRHGSRIEPHVDQIFLPVHRLSGGRNQYNVVHVRAVQVDFLVILFRVVSHFEILEGILLHDSGLYRFFYFLN